VTCEPTSEIAEPAQNFRNSRCRQSEDTISDYINGEQAGARTVAVAAPSCERDPGRGWCRSPRASCARDAPSARRGASWLPRRPRDCRSRADDPSSRDFRYGPTAAPMTASTEPPVPSVSSSTRPNSSTAVIFGAPWGLCPRVPGVRHSERRVQRHPCRIATHSSSPSLRGARDHVGCHASRSMR
jgi:hypothetical protein